MTGKMAAILVGAGVVLATAALRGERVLHTV